MLLLKMCFCTTNLVPKFCLLMDQFHRTVSNLVPASNQSCRNYRTVEIHNHRNCQKQRLGLRKAQDHWWNLQESNRLTAEELFAHIQMYTLKIIIILHIIYYTKSCLNNNNSSNGLSFQKKLTAQKSKLQSIQMSKAD